VTRPHWAIPQTTGERMVLSALPTAEPPTERGGLGDRRVVAHKGYFVLIISRGGGIKLDEDDIRGRSDTYQSPGQASSWM
jgi:hypothetical protein